MLKAESIKYQGFELQESRPVRTFLISDHRILIDAFTDLTRTRNDFLIVGSITELGLIQRHFKTIPLSYKQVGAGPRPAPTRKFSTVTQTIIISPKNGTSRPPLRPL